eukprot:CAMPEP_0204643100 /NCGR_PEP_ID=MMETSP0718-20130828/426_1 /ASSEMBLY_ACC=CAM_ASM_000674 /TAXON_ID=230516 /ORGANISM="Chaetoceros curvisetus" /LENGTH=473 /DNA_ID=CAMNT_0051664167 /DNA_START=533 /DNA_END=1951 /DNA_ORIENTATION=-
MSSSSRSVSVGHDIDVDVNIDTGAEVTYVNTVAGEVPPIEWFGTKTAQIVTTVTGSISAISSGIIILFILRSKGKLSLPYHRIMFFMSFCDILLSISMALTIIPMPSDKRERYYWFDGTSHGSIATCEIQGFLYLACTGMCVGANCILCIFYVSTIRYNVKEKTMGKLVPILLLLCMISPISYTAYMVHKGLLNPTPFDPFCSYAPLPYDCKYTKDEFEELKLGSASESGSDMDLVISEDHDYDANVNLNVNAICIRGDPYSYALSHIMSIVLIGTQFPIVLASMALIVSKFHKEAVALKHRENQRGVSALTRTHGVQAESNNNRGDCDILPPDSESVSSLASSDSNIAMNELQMTEDDREEERDNLLKMRQRMLKQAMMYIGAFFLTWCFPMIFLAPTFFVSDNPLNNSTIKFLRLVFQPLQGFFNALIFFYHKADNVRHADLDVGWVEALRVVFVSPSKVPEMLISDIIFV